MQGVNRFSGQVVDDVIHVKQSIKDILTTPLGSRVQLRHYGSRLFYFIDKPMNNETVINVILATAEAIDEWEPRAKLTRVVPIITENGRLNLDVEFTYLPDGKAETLRGVEI